ncbi:MAG: hypothetical protein ABIP03_05660 [Aquihabitans sp.]
MSASATIHRQPSRAWRAGLAAVAIGLILGVSACSSNDSNDAKKATTTTTATAGPDAGTTPSSGPAKGSATDATTTAAPPTPAPDLSGREKEYADALIATYDAANDMFTKPQVVCMAKRWVPIIGVDTFEAKGVQPSDLADASSDMSSLKLDEPTAMALVKVLPKCNIDLRSMFIDPMTASATPSQKACINKAITTEAIEQILAASFQGKPENSPNPTDLAAKCLTPKASSSPTSTSQP